MLKVEFMKFSDVQEERLQITSRMTVYYVLLIINVFLNIIYGCTGSKLDTTHVALEFSTHLPLSFFKQFFLQIVILKMVYHTAIFFCMYQFLMFSSGYP